MRARLRIGLALAAAAVLAAGCGDAAAPPEAEALCPESGPTCVRVGVGQPLFLGTLLLRTDPVGVDAANSIALAIDYLDGGFDGVPGQLLGHDIALLEEDDQCSSPGGRTGALRLAQERSLIAVLGTSCSAAALGAADVVLAQRGILLLSPSNSAPGLTAVDTHQRTYFRTAFNDLIQASADADFAYSRMGWRSAAAVHRDGDAYTTQLSAAFGEAFTALGGEVLGDVGLRDGTTPEAAAAELARLDPDVVFLADNRQSNCVATILAIRAQPALRRTPVVVPDACQSPELRTAAGRDLPEVYASGPDFSYVASEPFYREAYLPAYRRLTGGAPTGVWHPQAWDAANLLFAAIRRAAIPTPGGGLVIERERLRRALLTVQGYQGLSGRLTCGTLGDCAESARIGVYRYPEWPVNDANAKPIFSQLKTLAQVANTG